MKALAAIALLFGLAGGCLPPAQAQAEPAELSMVFVGDIMLDDTPGRVIQSGRDPFAYFAPLLKSADYRVGNLESIIATTGKAVPGKPYTFRAHPRVLKYLKRHFDAVSLANNHAGDFGAQALAQTLRLLDQNAIAHFGAGLNLAQAHEPLIVERKGLRVALLGYNEFHPRSFEADFDKAGVAWSEDEQVRFDIANARSRARADIVIAVMHWGWEDETTPSARQRELARLMIDAGADAVVGGHPHVVQDIEHYAGRPIFYSLGNFVFDGFSEEINNTGWLVQLRLDRQGVRAWRTHTARIDRQGIPRPAHSKSDWCWERGQDTPGLCAAQVR